MLVVTIIVFTFFFYNQTAPTNIYTLSLHDALPIYNPGRITIDLLSLLPPVADEAIRKIVAGHRDSSAGRSEEHTSELQSHSDLVCRLLLEKKKRVLPGYVLVNMDLNYESFTVIKNT